MKSALALVLVVAIGIAAAAPGVVLAPRLALDPLRDTPWEGAWSTLAVGANGARAAAQSALAGAAWAASVAALFVAGLTVLTLSVARAAQRRSDITVRRAVGASRRALARAALLEGAIVALIGLILGVAVGAVVTAVMQHAWPGSIDPAGLTPLLWVPGVAAVVVLGALFPLRFARPRMPGADATGRGVPLVVPTAQFGLGLLGLLAGAQLSRRTSAPVAGTTPVAASVVVPLSFETSRTVPFILDSVLRAMRADSGIALASISSPGTLLGLGHVDMITTECGQCYQGGIATPLRVTQATNHLATADTFRAMGLRVAHGRVLADEDRGGATRVAVVNRYLAERGFENEQAVGRQVRVGGPDNWYRIVGIVDDGEFVGVGVGALPRSRVYLSALQHAATELDLLVATKPGRAPTSVSIDRGVLLDEVVAREIRAARWFAGSLTLAGWGALLLAGLGMFAVMRMWVAGALPELALRRAVGARRHRVLGRIMARALTVAAGGALVAWWLEPLAGAAVARAVAQAPAGGLTLVSSALLALLAATLGAAATAAWRVVRAAPATLPGFSDL